MVKPFISVVIPVYNRSEALLRTLQSVLQQTWNSFEIIVIDDGSEVDIYPVIEKLNDPRIIYQKLKHTNANVARNYGIKKSKGEYIAMLDADDLWLENHLEECIKTLQPEQADGLYGSLIVKNMVTKQEKTVQVRPLHKEESMIDYLLKMSYGAQTSTLFMTKESAESIGWDATLNRHQDYDFVIRYNKQYKLIPKTNPTVLYTLGEPKQAVIDFASCIQVIKDNENDITPALYHKYHIQMLSLAKQKNASDHIITHYKREATHYKEYINFYQFLQIRQPRTGEERTKCREEYLSYIKEIEIE